MTISTSVTCVVLDDDNVGTSISMIGSLLVCIIVYLQKHLGSGKESRLHIWDLVTSVQVLSAHQVDFLTDN
jgi:hypothetical protein